MNPISKYLALAIVIYISGCSYDLPDDVYLAYAKVPSRVSYNYDVKPILSDKCFACHGPDIANRKGDLRLDIPEEAFRALGETGDHHAILPGKISESMAVKRILTDEPSLLMPPLDSHLKLTAEDKAIIIKWIEQGANYEKHWSFVPVKENMEPPAVQHSDWVRSPIDQYVLSNLESKGISPASHATRESLIRRASFDLRGLPPTISEINEFVNDSSSNAYEKVVDRFLASDAYGERMTAEWLDVARYADSDGYLDDKHRDFSPWRDWVIKAFNENMSYEQFVTWQIAGDLVDNRTIESVLATAFNRLHRKNSEAGIVFEEFRTEYVADRTLTLGKAFMGLTVECARCHDHKYDPISQKDYYSMFAFFNSTNEIGTAVYGPDQTPGPALLLTTPQKDSIITFIESLIASTETTMREKHSKAAVNVDDKSIEGLLANISQHQVAHYSFDQMTKKSDEKYLSPERHGRQKPMEIKEPKVKAGVSGNALFLNEFTTVKFPEKFGWHQHTEPFSFSLSIYPDTIYHDVNLLLHCEDKRLGLKGYSLFLQENKLQFNMAHSWPQNAIQVVTTEPVAIQQWSEVTVTYDGSGLAEGLQIYKNGIRQDREVLGERVYKSILHEYDIHTYGFNGLQLGLRGGMKTFIDGGLDELKWYDKELSEWEVIAIHSVDQATQWLSTKPDVIARHAVHQRRINDPLFVENMMWRDSLNSVMDDIPEIMVMGDIKVPRKTYVLDRGMYDAPTTEVQPDVPDAVLPFDEELPRNRLGLAKWLFDDKNPLTARVFVNRVWAMHFGQGIVRTPDDFGAQGDLPINPGLLDYLSRFFMDQGWDIKALHKEIMMSSTYRQSSVIQPELLAQDPDNTLLARGSRFRLSAEMIRDNALSASGLLVDQLGGQSVYPYQPDGLWDEISNKHWRYKYLQEPGDGLYRRSIYTIWKRTSPPPAMLIFDAPDRSVCTVSRKPTSTPLQALVLLNDPQMIEAARAMAEHIKKSEEDSLRQLRIAFKTLLGREPDETESVLLSSYYEHQKSMYSERLADAVAFLNTGESERDTSLDPAETAALAFVINGLMNTSEGYSRN